MSDPNLSSFIWSVADLLRGDYKQSEYGILDMKTLMGDKDHIRENLYNFSGLSK